MARRRHGANRHDQRVDDDVMGGNAKIGGAFDDLFRHGKAHIRVLGDPCVVIGDRHDRHVVFLDQWQHDLQPLFLSGDGVQQRAAFAGLKPRLKRAGDRTVDADRHVDGILHDLDQLRHQHRLDKVVVGIARVFGHFVGEDRARVHVEHRGACGDLRDGIRLDPRKIALLQLLAEDLAARGVDPLSDHAKRLVKADDGGLGLGFDDGSGHVTSFRLRRRAPQRRRHSLGPMWRWS